MRIAVMRGRGGPVSFAACLAAGGLLAAGCAGAPASSPATVKLTGAEIAVLTNSGTAVAAAEVNNAFEALVQRCMESRGLVYYPLIRTAAEERSGIGLAGVPQALIGLAAREADGYGFYASAVRNAASPGGQGGPAREERYADSAPPSYRMALDGPDSYRVSTTLPGGMTTSVNAGGCRGAAERRMYGSVANYLLATTGASNLSDEVLYATTADPAFSAVVARWSSCMARYGYRYASPESLWNGLATRVDRKPTPAARDLEIRVSVTDYRCSAAVRLLATIRALQDKHARYLSRILAGDLARLTQIDARALKAANALHLTG